MMTTEMILALVAEMKEEETKTETIPVYYKRHGQMVRRSYDDRKYTDRYKELFYGDAIRSHKVFRCECCGRMVDYFSLETWQCDFDEGDYLCSMCYEEGMGDDL
jgi:hypothetical protein